MKIRKCQPCGKDKPRHDGESKLEMIQSECLVLDALGDRVKVDFGIRS